MKAFEESPPTIRLSSKGQLVIPLPIRKRHGFRKGTALRVLDRGPDIVLQPVTGGSWRSLRGILKRPGSPSAAEEIAMMRAAEKREEEARFARSLKSAGPR